MKTDAVAMIGPDRPRITPQTFSTLYFYIHTDIHFASWGGGGVRGRVCAGGGEVVRFISTKNNKKQSKRKTRGVV
jgi:hypothetical protein